METTTRDVPLHAHCVIENKPRKDLGFPTWHSAHLASGSSLLSFLKCKHIDPTGFLPQESSTIYVSGDKSYWGCDQGRVYGLEDLVICCQYKALQGVSVGSVSDSINKTKEHVAVQVPLLCSHFNVCLIIFNSYEITENNRVIQRN